VVVAEHVWLDPEAVFGDRLRGLGPSAFVAWVSVVLYAGRVERTSFTMRELLDLARVTRGGINGLLVAKLLHFEGSRLRLSDYGWSPENEGD
jgi:hypothetical protein